MAKASIARKRKKRNRKKWVVSPQAPLCALGKVLRARSVFQPLHEGVNIRQKTVVYRPTDKLVFVVLWMLSGAETVCEINTKVRPDRALLEAFGYQRCADASVIRQTLDAATEATVLELETVLASMSRQHSVVASGVSRFQTGASIDIDLSALPIGKRSEGAKKGYISKKQNTYTRQLARLMCSDTQEILCNELYAGDTRSDTVFKKMIGKLEMALALDTPRNAVKFISALMPGLARMRISIMRYGVVISSWGRCILRAGSRS